MTITIPRRRRLVLLLGALAPPCALGFPPQRRLDDGLGKWKDAPPTEIDCTLSSVDYGYYLERCWDGLTMWWANGQCVDGEKRELSELHRCHTPDGSMPYCHDCVGGDGSVKCVCGSDRPDRDEVCGIAWAGTAEGCGRQWLTAYSHQCLEPSGGSKSWYVRESFECDFEYVGRMGPNTEDVPAEFACRAGWYYPHVLDDRLDDPRAFSSAGNKYCLDCGLGIGVCTGSEEATCESLGLPKRGEPFVSTAAPYVAPPPLFTDPPGFLVSPAPTTAPSSAPLPSKGFAIVTFAFLVWTLAMLGSEVC